MVAIVEDYKPSKSLSDEGSLTESAMASLAQLREAWQRERNEVEAIAPDGEKLSLTLKPAPIVIENFPALFLQARNGDADLAAAYLLCEVLSGWGLTAEGEPYPLNLETASALPLPVLCWLVCGLRSHISQRTNCDEDQLSQLINLMRAQIGSAEVSKCQSRLKPSSTARMK
jgi:hypothetical protein